MQSNSKLKANPKASVSALNEQTGQRPNYKTVEQFSSDNPCFSSSSLRNLIFKADERQSSKGVISGNGLVQAGAIVRIGRKVLINEERFFGG